MVGLAHAGGQVREGGEEDHHDQEEGDAQQYGYADYEVKKGCRVKNRTQPWKYMNKTYITVCCIRKALLSATKPWITMNTQNV